MSEYSLTFFMWWREIMRMKRIKNGFHLKSNYILYELNGFSDFKCLKMYTTGKKECDLSSLVSEWMALNDYDFSSCWWSWLGRNFVEKRN